MKISAGAITTAGARAAEGAGATALGTPVGAGTAEAVAAVAVSPVGLNNFINPMD